MKLKITGKTAKKICAGSTNAGARCTTAADCPEGSCLGYYALKLKAYGGADNAVSDMQTQIYGGGYGWAVRGMWQQFPKGWRLYKKSALLDPYL